MTITNSNDELKEVDINSLVVGKNSRWRVDNANLGELMESIKQHGILQPIVVRKEDNVIICGNRRLAASKILGFKTIPVIFKENISDEDLLILNLIENMQRKDITSIEIGMQCYELIENAEFKIGINELAAKLGFAVTRIKICLEAYKSLPAEFRKSLTNVQSGKRVFGQLPESATFAALNFSRYYKDISEKELKLLLKKIQDEKWGSMHISILGQLYSSGMSFKNAIRELNKYKIVRVNYIVLKTELANVMNTEKETSPNVLLKNIIKRYNQNLVF